MMRRFKIFGPSVGALLTISAAAGALTAGPSQIGPWGITPPAGGSAGTIAIDIDRSTLQCAPDSVRMGLDLSGATLDTAGPTGGEIYDARLHNVIYLWDFGDTGQWAMPVNVMADWKDHNVGLGPWVSHVYSTHGPKTVTLYTWEPSSGKTSTSLVNFSVLDPDAVYPGARTICVNPVGDSDFAAAPAGAVPINADSLLAGSAPWTTYADAGNPVRWLFKRGASYTVAVDVALAQGKGMYFGAYGTGNRPILNGAGAATPAAASHSVIYYNNGHDGLGGADTPDARFAGLNFQGNHAPAFQTQLYDTAVLDWHAVKFLKYVDAVFHDCRMAGFTESTISDYTSDNTKRINIHLNAVYQTDFGGQYPNIMQPERHLLSSFSATGCRFTQRPEAMDDSGIRAIIRLNHIAKTYIAGCDFFHTDRTQPCVKLIETPAVDGAIANVHSCSMEGGLRVLTIGLNGKNAGLERSSVHNVIIDGLVLVGNHGTQAFFKTAVTGVTLRNLLMIQPAAPHLPYAAKLLSFVDMEQFGTFDPAIVGAAPIEIYNCTMRCDRSSAQNSGDMQAVVQTSAAPNFTAISHRDNLIHGPGLTSLGSAFAPVTDTALWTPRCNGTTIGWDRSDQVFLPADVPNGQTYFVPYWTLDDGTVMTQAHFAGAGNGGFVDLYNDALPGDSKLVGTYRDRTGAISISYGATGFTITNNSGITWGAGWRFFFTCDLGSTFVYNSTFATPLDAVKATYPDTGSPALAAVIDTSRAGYDVAGAGVKQRPFGAVDVGAKQMTAA